MQRNYTIEPATEERKSRGMLLAERIKIQYEELIDQMERHIRDVEKLRSFKGKDRYDLNEGDDEFYARYQDYLEHILCELEEGC